MYLYPCMPNRIYSDSKLFADLDQDPAWVAEIKKNGWRCLVEKTGGRVTLWTRRYTTIPDLPDLKEYLTEMLPEGILLDGELIDRRTKDIKGLWYAFDILYLGTEFFHNKPFSERRKELEKHVWDVPGKIEVAKQYRLGKKMLYERVIDEGEEGIVIKKLDSTYPTNSTKSHDNPYWLKVKPYGK